MSCRHSEEISEPLKEKLQLESYKLMSVGCLSVVMSDTAKGKTMNMAREGATSVYRRAMRWI